MDCPKCFTPFSISINSCSECGHEAPTEIVTSFIQTLGVVNSITKNFKEGTTLFVKNPLNGVEREITVPPMLGATDEFPDGKISKDDEGELRLKLVADSDTKNLVIDFGKLVKWLAFSRDEGIALGQAILDTAMKIPE